ncbi:MAG: 6-carboxytetrahydropterin synthase QueD [Candidatus Eremiobacteraeota bacterium]|nr:6-carboxytetrahydropterin synthase QueD [Candidatus Eremiobacteraeota bacterium]
MQVRKTFRFEAAHVLPHHPGKCSRLHGHSYRLEVAVEGPVQEEGPARGMVVDFDDVNRIVNERIVTPLDHSSLNDFIPNPTCENILTWIWERLWSAFPDLTELVLWETPTACAVLRSGDPEGVL